MTNIAEVLNSDKMNSLTPVERERIIDTLSSTEYADLAMDLFIKDHDLGDALDGLELMEAQDLYNLHKTFFHRISSRADVLSYEEAIKGMPTAFDECPYPLFHTFADGMYTREMHFNKGDLIVGAIHKNEYFVNILKGRIWVASEFGAKEIKAPASFTAKAGVKHIGFTLEDTVWSDTHKVESVNIEDAEKEIFADSYEDLDAYNNVLVENNHKQEIRGELCLVG